MRIRSCDGKGRYIALTFDDGPHEIYTPQLLKMLGDRQIKATFFCVGQQIEKHPELAKQITSEGHEIGNHTWSHANLGTLSFRGVRDEISRTHEIIKKTTGICPKLIRAPYGIFPKKLEEWASDNQTFGYKSVMWSLDTRDWEDRDPVQTLRTILLNVKPGSIILCHDVYKETIDALPTTLDVLRIRGYKFLTVSQLISRSQGSNR